MNKKETGTYEFGLAGLERLDHFERDALEGSELRIEVVVLANSSVRCRAERGTKGRLDAGSLTCDGHGDHSGRVVGEVDVEAF